MTGLKEDETKATVEALRKVAGKIRHHLGKRIQLRYTPELDFRYDEAPERGGRIDADAQCAVRGDLFLQTSGEAGHGGSGTSMVLRGREDIRTRRCCRAIVRSKTLMAPWPGIRRLDT